MKVLSIDIGSQNIKAAEIDISFGRVDLGNHRLLQIVEPPAPTKEAQKSDARPEASSTNENKNNVRIILTEGQKNALRKIIGETQFKYERIVVNVPKSWTTNRVFQFPTKDRKTIHNSLNFELEDELPFQLEDVLSDFCYIKSENALTSIYASVALKSDISSLIMELQMLGIDPDYVTTDAMAFSYLLRKSLPDNPENTRGIAIVNLGALQSGIHIFSGHDPYLSLTCQCGGNSITKHIATHYNISEEEAENGKKEGSFIITETHLKSPVEITNDQKQFSAVVEEALSPLLREMKQAIITYKNQTSKDLKAIYLTGGSSLIPNIHLYLEELLKLPVYYFHYLPGLVGQNTNINETDEAFLSGAIALGILGTRPERNSMINFRQGEYAKKSGMGFSLQSYKKFIGYSAATLAFIYFNLILQYNILSKKLEKEDIRYEKTVKSVLGAISPSTIKTYLASPSTLKTAVDKELAKHKESFAVSVKAPYSGLDLLNKISTTMPKDMKLDTQLFQFKDGNFKISGTVDNSAGLDKIKKALEDTKLLSDVTKNKSEEDSKKKFVRFEFTSKLMETLVAEAPGERKSK